MIGFCRDNHFHGILAENAEYAIFDPPRYFSSKQLKLTYKVDRSKSVPADLVTYNFVFILIGFIGNERIHFGRSSQRFEFKSKQILRFGGVVGQFSAH